MAGNVAEWCVNAADERRYILGASWKDAAYEFMGPSALDPFDRSETNGIRCARYDAAPHPKLLAPIPVLIHDFSGVKPVDDRVFEVYKRLYAYDRTELKAAVESVDESSPHWRKETLSFDAPYGGERIIAYLFLPRNASPPYQSLLWFQGAGALYVSSIEPELAFIPKSGRALMFPVYQEMFQRRRGLYFRGPQAGRDIWIHWVQEMMRSLDYLGTRDDIDDQKFAFAGLSLGPPWVPWSRLSTGASRRAS
jgi:hypothetical protein